MWRFEKQIVLGYDFRVWRQVNKKFLKNRSVLSFWKALTGPSVM